MLEFRHKVSLWHIVKSYTRNTKYIIVQAAFPAFYGTWRFITAFTTVHHLSLPEPNQSVPLPITLLTGAACFLPGRAKDLSAPP